MSTMPLLPLPLTLHTPQALDHPPDDVGCHLSFSISDHSDRVAKESAKTIQTTQKTIAGLMQQLQTTSQDNESLRGELMYLTSALKQKARAHQEKSQALKNRLEQLKSQTFAMQHTLNETERTCNERVEAAMREQPVALQALAQATQERRAALERAHAQTITTLERAHTETMSILTGSHTRALATLQTQFTQITCTQTAAVNRARHDEEESTRLTAELSTAQTSLQDLSRELAVQQDISARARKNQQNWAFMNSGCAADASNGRP